MDLGADGWQTFRYVLLPQIATALLAGGMLAFALSFDEIIVTLFTALWAGPVLALVTSEPVDLGPDAVPSLLLLAASSWLAVRWIQSFPRR